MHTDVSMAVEVTDASLAVELTDVSLCVGQQPVVASLASLIQHEGLVGHLPGAALGGGEVGGKERRWRG